jgi:hypothetical protein
MCREFDGVLGLMGLTWLLTEREPGVLGVGSKGR